MQKIELLSTLLLRNFVNLAAVFAEELGNFFFI